MNTEQKLRDRLREVLEYCEQLGYELGLTGLEAKIALAQPEQEPAEPVAWLVTWIGSDGMEWVHAHASEPDAIDQARVKGGKCEALYTTLQPAPLVRLTEDELGDLFGEDEDKDCWRVVKNEDGTVKGVAFNQEWQHKFYVRCMDAMQAKAQPVPEPLVWKCKAGGLKKLTQKQYEKQAESIKKRYTKIETAPDVRELVAILEQAEHQLRVVGCDITADHIRTALAKHGSQA